jgi:uncharacterized protein YlzI (FlbEa/FlbD family)
MIYLEFKLARDGNQAKMVTVQQAQIAAVLEIDQKKTELLINGESIMVHGSYAEVTAKIRQGWG